MPAKVLLSAIWLFAAVSMGFSESFPNRPTANELDGIVISGTQCARGVNERCWATQYSTNPVSYHVAPFTNNSCWYLDQSLMETIASKARSLVSYYVNPATVYDGTTNITMLTVTGVWAQIEIGDHTNQFTLTPAGGTNTATYGDNPWRISQTNLTERYNVLHVLKWTRSPLSVWYPDINGAGEWNSTIAKWTNWVDAVAGADEGFENNRGPAPQELHSLAFGYKKSDTHWYASYRLWFGHLKTQPSWTNEHEVVFYLYGIAEYGSGSDTPAWALNNSEYAVYQDQYNNGILHNYTKGFFTTQTMESEVMTPVLPVDGFVKPDMIAQPIEANQWYVRGQTINFSLGAVLKWENGFKYCK
ncbi:MAG: hypothetical protein PHW65_02910 [Dehalococcoidales bacterium]|nr:hypothetical protein [Dehalococcoidales bacterium]